jgi:excisionase family DNA binding protein
MQKKTMTVREVASTLNVCYHTALELVKQEGFPCVNIGRRKVVPIDGFAHWLEENSKKGGEQNA